MSVLRVVNSFESAFVMGYSPWWAEAAYKTKEKTTQRNHHKMNPYLINTLSFLVGLLLGHRLALWRDKRKELNDIADPIRALLFKERNRPSPMFAGPTEIDADRLQYALPFWRRRSFSNAWNAYQQAKQQGIGRGPCGSCYFVNPDNIVSHIDAVLAYTVKR
jgi:hypothetical protein